MRFWRRKPETPQADLRGHLLKASPSDFGLRPTDDLPRVWAALMEVGTPAGAASIVAVADGSASMYTSTGGGMIGVGEHARGRAAALAFLIVIEQHLDALPPSVDAPLPVPGEYAFVALTYDGMRRAVAPESDLSDEAHPLFAAFFAGHELITEMRELQDETTDKKR